MDNVGIWFEKFFMLVQMLGHLGTILKPFWTQPLWGGAICTFPPTDDAAHRTRKGTWNKEKSRIRPHRGFIWCKATFVRALSYGHGLKGAAFRGFSKVGISVTFVTKLERKIEKTRVGFGRTEVSIQSFSNCFSRSTRWAWF